MGFLSGMVTSGVSGVQSTANWADDDDRWYSSEPSAMSLAGRNASPDAAMRVSAVYQCVTIRAQLFASLPFNMFKLDMATGGKSVDNSHPISDLLRYQPNKWQTAWDFWNMMHVSVGLHGNGLAEIVPGRRGFASSLEPLVANQTTAEMLTDGTLRYNTVDMLGRSKKLLQDEVFHIRGKHCIGFMGVSPVRYARETIGVALAAEEHGARTFSNGARPSGIVHVPKAMSDTAFERFKSDWRGAYNGLAGAGATPILEDGAEFKPITMSSKETQFLETREFQIEEICRWFDVPPVLLHHHTKTSSWGTGVEAIMLAFNRNNFEPLISGVQQAIRRDLVLAQKLYEPIFDTEKLAKGDSKAQADYLSRLVLNGVITRNEARQYLGYDPLSGLDEPLVPTNTATSDGLPGNGGDEPKKANSEISV